MGQIWRVKMMYIKKGSILRIKNFDNIDLPNISQRDKNIYNNLINVVKPEYMICLRPVDDLHFLVACIRKKKSKCSILLNLTFEENLWINYCNFYDVNSCFLEVKYKSTDCLCQLVSTVYEEHNKIKGDLIQKKNSKTSSKKAYKRQKLYKDRLNKQKIKKKKIFGDPDDPRTNDNPVEMRKFNCHDSNKNEKINNEWWNVNYPVSSGRGNF